jgi:hypothetical protein
MKEIPQHPDDFAQAFESAFAHLQVEALEACGRHQDWPEKVAAAIYAALDFAAANPTAARPHSRRADRAP